MTTVTSLTADRMLAIEAASVVDGDVVGDNLILTKHDGTQINAGSVRGPQGVPGPMGTMLPIATAQPVLDIGLINQIRAGRQLTAADFTNMGLSAPLGLWNLSDLSDVSGNGRNLNNKGAVPFAAGINGGASTAAQFVGSTAQALYIPDTGANDPFQIKTGSFGCWFRCAKRGTAQYMFSKMGYTGSAATLNWGMYIDGATNRLYGNINNGTGSGSTQPFGLSDVADDRWHFGIITHNGTMTSLYVDGILEATVPGPPIAPSSVPLNIGGFGADGSTATNYMFFGRVDEAFVTADILSEEQIRNLYCVKISHTLGAAPSRVTLNVRRRRKGATLAVADFPTQPLRLYNFSGGSLGDEGSNGVALTNNGAAVSVAGPDGSSGNAFNFNGAQGLVATDAGLPAGLNPRSYGVWFKSSSYAGNPCVVQWCNGGTELFLLGTSGVLTARSGGNDLNGPGIVTDGQWHFAVIVENNTAQDGVLRKMYIDSRLVAGATVMNSMTLGGATGFSIGIAGAGQQLTGQIDGVFVCDYALTAAQIASLYAKGSQALTPSPKNVGDHVEGMDANNIYATFDSLESQHQVDLMVAT